MSSKVKYGQEKPAFVLEKGAFSSFFPGLWWMLFFWLLCFAVYSQAMQKKTKVCLDLKNKIQELESLKQSSLEEREDLVLQIASQNDKDWIEMVLKKRLGVVPEGQMKVYFKKEE